MDNIVAKRELARLTDEYNALRVQYMRLRDKMMEVAYNTTKASIRGGAPDISNLSNAVSDFEQSLRAATKNSHIGTKQCCDALESASEKMKKAKKLLFVDN